MVCPHATLPPTFQLVVIEGRRGAFDLKGNALGRNLNTTGLQVVSTRAGFSDAFAAQHATCLFYKLDGTAVRTSHLYVE